MGPAIETQREERIDRFNRAQVDAADCRRIENFREIKERYDIMMC